ncbi:DUF6527 family protein [Aliiroseovarius sp. CAU 1755]
MKARTVEYRFVDSIPSRVDESVVYVSIEFATAVHKCLCGCGQEVVTPLSPTDWKLTYDGASISLEPSVGNWSFDCQSHYWIRRNHVKWAGQMSEEQIAAVRAKDVRSKGSYFSSQAENQSQSDQVDRPSLFARFAKWIGF